MKQLNKNLFDIHADDYALSESSDKDIINLCKNAKLNSISIIPNLDIFDSSVKKFLDSKPAFKHDIKISVHLNIMEGKSVAPIEALPNLVDKEGFFTVSWGKLFLWNYLPLVRRKIKKQLTKEITAQINACIDAKIMDPQGIRIDSHQHPHMIPLFFDALTDSIKENHYKIEYIRNTCDPIRFYLSNKNGLKSISLSNIIKCLILNFYSHKVSRYIKRSKLKDSYLFGVFFSGKMDERVASFIPVFEKKSETKNRICELLFHPGLMLETELTQEFTKTGFNEFHLSSNRKIEYNTCNSL